MSHLHSLHTALLLRLHSLPTALVLTHVSCHLFDLFLVMPLDVFDMKVFDMKSRDSLHHMKSARSRESVAFLFDMKVFD